MSDDPEIAEAAERLHLAASTGTGRLRALLLIAPPNDSANSSLCPQALSEGLLFDRKRRMVHVIDGIKKRGFPTNIQNVAAEGDFNRIEAEGIEPDKLEADFSEFETEVAAAIERTCQRAFVPTIGRFYLVRHLLEGEERRAHADIIIVANRQRGRDRPCRATGLRFRPL